MSEPNKRGCYCDATARPEPGQPPPGFCGFCQSCGAPGHTRHFPGMSPTTGSWCDRHYLLTMGLHPLGIWGSRLWPALILAAMFAWSYSRRP